MPTIALNNGLVILKGGLVSCTCCEEEPTCCMYPATGLGVDYGESDLPTAVTIKWPDHLEGSASKSGSQYTSGNVTLKRNEAETAWILEDDSDPEDIVTRTVGSCLIRGDGNYTADDDLVEDQFNGNYTVTEGSDAGTVTRESLCLWTGSIREIEGLAELSYGPNPESGFGPDYKWQVHIQGGDVYIKDTNQNSPVGVYTHETLAVTITVS